MSPVVRLRVLGPFFFLLASLLLTPPPLNAREQKAPPPPATVVPLVSVPSFPGLAAKAPGAPGYGLQVTSSTGKYMLTGMSYDPITHKPAARLGRIVGPAGRAYRLGVTLSYSARQAIPEDHLNPCWYDDYFVVIGIENGSPAQRAGLKVKDFWVIRSVDDSNFGWDVNALIWHISNSPEVEISTERPGAFFCSKKTFRIKTSKLETPVDPADGNLEAVQEADADAEVKAWIKDNKTWKDLLILRSQTDKFAPLALSTCRSQAVGGTRSNRPVSSGKDLAAGERPGVLEGGPTDRAFRHRNPGCLAGTRGRPADRPGSQDQGPLVPPPSLDSGPNFRPAHLIRSSPLGGRYKLAAQRRHHGQRAGTAKDVCPSGIS